MNEENKTPEEQKSAEVPAEETAVEETAAEETVTEAAGESAVSEENAAAESAESTEEAPAETDGAAVEEAVVEVPEDKEPAKSGKGTLIAVIAAVVVVVIAIIIAIFVFGKSFFNPYTKDYIDVTGKTVGQIADEQGMEYKDFLDLYGLPSDMPSSTSENAAYYNIPAGTFAAMSGTDFDTLKEILELTDDDSITEETTIGEVFDKTTVGARVGEDQIDAFKAEYGLDDSVTADTLWGDIRNTIDQKTKEQNEAALKQEEATDEPEEDEADLDSETDLETDSEETAQTAE